MSPGKNLPAGTQGLGCRGRSGPTMCVSAQEQVQRQVKGGIPARVWGFLSMRHLPKGTLWTPGSDGERTVGRGGICSHA